MVNQILDEFNQQLRETIRLLEREEQLLRQREESPEQTEIMKQLRRY